MTSLRPILFVWLLGACGVPEYSPWQVNVDTHDLTAKALGRLAGDDTDRNSFKIALIGDTQLTPQAFKDVRNTINARGDIAFTMLAGDITDSGLKREFMWMVDIVDGFHAPLLTVVGNHDGLGHGREIYQDMFGPLDYSFTHRGIRFVMWNNNSYEWNVDFDWLENELSQGEPTVVVSHQPPSSNALSDEDRERWRDLRRRENYKASLHGHVHHFEYHLEDGTTPIIVVDRVLGTNYAVVEFREDGSIEPSFCKPACGEYTP